MLPGHTLRHCCLITQSLTYELTLANCPNLKRIWIRVTIIIVGLNGENILKSGFISNGQIRLGLDMMSDSMLIFSDDTCVEMVTFFSCRWIWSWWVQSGGSCSSCSWWSVWLVDCCQVQTARCVTIIAPPSSRHCQRSSLLISVVYVIAITEIR